MPIGTAVHARTFALAESLNYREWSGYYAVSAYEAHHEHEYNAIRNAAALIDVSPLFKYMVRGRDAVKLVDRVITRDAFKLAIGQVYYTPWCDERGKVIDDGTVTRVAAGLLLIDVDFNSSKKALIESQKYTPFEMGLGRLVQLDARPFVGRAALIKEKQRGPARQIVGLEVSWPAVEKLYDGLGLAA